MSSRYRELRRRIGVLKRRLPRPNPLGVYTDRQVDATLAFRLLAHAELESCIEDLAAATLKRSLLEYETRRVIGKPLLAVCATYDGKTPRDSYSQSEDLSAIVRDAVTRHYGVIARNHGIRESNLVRLLLPLGLEQSDLDPKWLADIDSFGSRRGDAAHRSIGSQRPPDPVQERSDVTVLVDGLAAVDRLLRRL
jgi:hypothetical protein